jgi:hypothetical protein
MFDLYTNAIGIYSYVCVCLCMCVCVCVCVCVCDTNMGRDGMDF